MPSPSSSDTTALVKRFDNAGIAVRDIDIMETFYRDVLGAQILPLEGFLEVGDIAAAQTWLESQGIAAGSIEDITIPGLGAFQYLRFKDPEGNLLGLRRPVTKE
jgi:hypothetical protein